MYQEAMKMTGVKIEYLHPPAGQVTEQFNLMLASGDLPDIIFWTWLTIPGGPEKAIADKVILRLNDLMKDHGRAIAGFLNGRPETARKVVTDSGSMYEVPFLRTWIKDPAESWERYFMTPQFRNDWLKELNLKVPETLDEWENVLKTFKKKGSDVIPLGTVPMGATLKNIEGLAYFMSAWGMDYGFYVADGKVHYGAAEPAYKEYLTLMNRWYKEGLIDQDFIGREYGQVRGMILDNRIGSFWGRLNSEMGGLSGLAAKDKHPTFELIGGPWPVHKKGDTSYHMNDGGGNEFPGNGAAITTKCKDPVIAMKWLNFWWTEPGHNLANFGIEGQTYNWVDGFPTYTDLIMKNPDGLAPVNALSSYSADGGGGRFWIQDARYWQQMMALPQQFETGKMLVRTGDISHVLPPITPTVEESRELAQLLNEIVTYRDEMFAKFIVGQEPLSKFDDYLKRINAMGMPRAIAIQQAALERFQKRPVPKL
jgi:putative aldouronate transport system substrate-binding protein